jgi:hypothetical protein
MIGAYRATHIIGTAARLGIADQLADGSKSPDELASLVRADPQALSGLLRSLVATGSLVVTPTADSA